MARQFTDLAAFYDDLILFAILTPTTYRTGHACCACWPNVPVPRPSKAQRQC